MSTAVMALCWPIRMPPTQKAVLISLADQANDQGSCWPSIATICVRTCFGERAVRKAVRWLEEQGLLAVGLGRKRSNVYTLALQRIQAICEAQVQVRAQERAEAAATAAAEDAFAPTAGAFEALLRSVGVVHGSAQTSLREPARGAAHHHSNLGSQTGTTCRQAAPDAGERHEMPHAVTGTTCRIPAPDAGQTGTTCPLTVNEPLNTRYPQPPSGAEGLRSRVQAKPHGDADVRASEGPAADRTSRKRNAVLTEVEAEDCRPLVSLQDFIADCRAKGEPVIPEDDPVFTYCEQARIGQDILQLHWHEFKARRMDQDKRQRDWRKTFLRSVQGNWFRLWQIPPGGDEAYLTTHGRQAEAVMLAQQGEGA
jgi:hypothetical protein